MANRFRIKRRVKKSKNSSHPVAFAVVAIHRRMIFISWIMMTRTHHSTARISAVMIVERVSIADVVSFAIFHCDVSGVLEIVFVLHHHRRFITMEIVEIVVTRVSGYWDVFVMDIIIVIANVLMETVQVFVVALYWVSHVSLHFCCR